MPGVERIIFGQERRALLAGGFCGYHRFIKEGHFTIDEARVHDVNLKGIPIPLPHTPTGGEIVLEHLLSDLNQRNVNVALTTTPMLWYEQRYTAEAREYFEYRMQEISERFKVPWYNWIGDYQFATNFWFDVNHLNDIGAKIFSSEKYSVLKCACFKKLP